MILNQAPESGRRSRGLTIAAGIWLLLVGLIAIVNSVGLSRLTGQVRHDARQTQIKALTQQVADVARQVDAGKRQPAPASQTELAALRQAVETRLARLEHAQAEVAPVSDLHALEGRVGAIETRQQALGAIPSQTVHRPQIRRPVKPKAPAPPFQVLGVELRGGQQFVSVALPGTSSLANVRLLREGDSAGGWQLQSIEAHAAVFLVNGQSQRVTLPTLP
ncbi:hypothetical protein [Burkholderia cepacia]|uniref:hypothetical protein n=1 Tax=Burkholderia cepacia TaxID=292 RepID=UPI002AB5E4D3|nr:hypothetical protein [Burkholderia cepacia]